MVIPTILKHAGGTEVIVTSSIICTLIVRKIGEYLSLRMENVRKGSTRRNVDAGTEAIVINSTKIIPIAR